MSGSRWLSTGAAIARITRGATGLGPGPSSETFRHGRVMGRHREAPGSFRRASAGSGIERRPRIAAVKPARSSAAFRPGMPKTVVTARASGVMPMLERQRFVVAARRGRARAGSRHGAGSIAATAMMAPRAPAHSAAKTPGAAPQRTVKSSGHGAPTGRRTARRRCWFPSCRRCSGCAPAARPSRARG